VEEHHEQQQCRAGRDENVGQVEHGPVVEANEIDHVTPAQAVRQIPRGPGYKQGARQVQRPARVPHSDPEPEKKDRHEKAHDDQHGSGGLFRQNALQGEGHAPVFRVAKVEDRQDGLRRLVFELFLGHMLGGQVTAPQRQGQRDPAADEQNPAYPFVHAMVNARGAMEIPRVCFLAMDGGQGDAPSSSSSSW
jgi:hypothetical protein